MLLDLPERLYCADVVSGQSFTWPMHTGVVYDVIILFVALSLYMQWSRFSLIAGFSP